MRPARFSDRFMLPPEPWLAAILALALFAWAVNSYLKAFP